jgi:hypothetical protein
MSNNPAEVIQRHMLGPILSRSFCPIASADCASLVFGIEEISQPCGGALVTMDGGAVADCGAGDSTNVNQTL